MTESPLAAAQRLFAQAVDALRGVAGAADEWVSVLSLCEAVGRQLDQVTVAAVAGLDREGVSRTRATSRPRRHSATCSAGSGSRRAAEPWPPNDPDTGRLVSQVPKEGEADIVRELFERLAQRHSLRRIEQDFAARGILNESGTPFSELFRATS